MPHRDKKYQQYTAEDINNQIKASGASGGINTGSKPSSNISSSSSSAPQTLQVVNTSGVKGSFNGDAELVFFLLAFLFVVVEWKNIVVPVFDLAWNNKGTSGGSNVNDIRNLPWKGSLGMLAFIFFAVMIASFGGAPAGVIEMMVAGFIVVYLIENNGGGFTTFFNWLNVPQQTSSSGGSSSQQPVPPNQNNQSNQTSGGLA